MCTNCKIIIVLTAKVDCTGPCFHHIKCRIKKDEGIGFSFFTSFMRRLWQMSEILASLTIIKAQCKWQATVKIPMFTRGTFQASEVQRLLHNFVIYV